MEKIRFYGTRGSCSLTSDKYMEFGGATTCILFSFKTATIMVDCGSGVNNALEDLKDVKELYLLVSHSHLDHLSGIATLLSSFGDKKIHIYGKTFNGVSVKESINRVMGQSLWPVKIESYNNVDFNEISGDLLEINGIKIYNMDSNHPGGCSLFKINGEGSTFVTAFDFCHLNGYEENLIKFANKADVLIYDGCLNQTELVTKTDWGHSTPEDGARIGDLANCKKVIITHFGAFDDLTLSSWEKEIQRKYPHVTFARSGTNKNELKKMIEIGTMLSQEKDNDILLTKVVETSMEITGADGGTLYLLDNNKLDFKVLINKSKNTKLVRKDSPVILPSVDVNAKNVCATSAREKKLINIPDCYKEKQYDFSGVKQYDALNNYFTQSVLVIPLIDEYDDVIGVLQLINSTDKDGKVVPFKKEDEDVLMAIANQASMAIVNSSYSQQINELLYGFVRVMSAEIDERTPYNANHTRNMVKYAERFFEYEETVDGKYKVDDKKQREILMSIWLHDIGKILTPISIMNKDERLSDENFSKIINRFNRRELLLKLELANKEITDSQYYLLDEERKKQLDLILKINKAAYLDDSLKNKLDELYVKTYKELDGSVLKVISEDEYHQLSIVKGTLTKEERQIMQDHVSLTQKFLSQLKFPKYYDQIPLYAGSHHEFLDGSGYPNKLTKVDLPWPCRLITVCDIFEALTAKDRPYKKPFSVEQSFNILYDMSQHGQLDYEIIQEFEKALK